MGKLDDASIRRAQLSLTDINRYFTDTEAAISLYYSAASPIFNVRFVGYRQADVAEERRNRLLELETTCSLTVLSTVEASLTVDYLLRCRARRRDKVTKSLMSIYRSSKENASFSDDILVAWRDNYPASKNLMSEVRGAFKYRHWLAHGRWWEPKLGRQSYDYSIILNMATNVFATLPLIRL